MSPIAQFAAYAAAFEEAYQSNDWSEVGRFFSDDACYEIGLPILGAERCEGRAAILEWFADVLDRFDRRFASRELALLEGPTVLEGPDVLESPHEGGAAVWLRGNATYRAEGVPDFVLELEETVRFGDHGIVLLADRYTPAMQDATERYLRAHGDALGIAIPPSKTGSA